MAWLLADAANVYLTGCERTMTFVELGSGENHLAIDRILNAVMSSRMTLPLAVFDRLTRWLDGYAGSPEEPQLRTLLTEIRAQQFEPVALRTQQALSDAATSACSISAHDGGTYDPGTIARRCGLPLRFTTDRPHAPRS
jgi:hypothetical protein